MNRLPTLPARGAAAFEQTFARRMLRLRKTVELNATSCSNAPAGPTMNRTFFETPWRRSRRHEIRGLNGRNRLAAPLLRSESADGRKMERVITKPDPDSADMDLSQREHLSPSEWENLLLYGQYLIDSQPHPHGPSV